MPQKAEPYQALFSLYWDTKWLLRENMLFVMFKDHSRPKVLEQSVPSASAYQKESICRSSTDLLAPELSRLKERVSEPTQPPDSQTELSCNHPGFSLQTESPTVRVEARAGASRSAE